MKFCLFHIFSIFAAKVTALCTWLKMASKWIACQFPFLRINSEKIRTNAETFHYYQTYTAAKKKKKQCVKLEKTDLFISTSQDDCFLFNGELIRASHTDLLIVGWLATSNLFLLMIFSLLIILFEIYISDDCVKITRPNSIRFVVVMKFMHPNRSKTPKLFKLFIQWIFMKLEIATNSRKIQFNNSDSATKINGTEHSPIPHLHISTGDYQFARIPNRMST